MTDALIIYSLAGAGAVLAAWAIGRALPFRRRRYCRGARSTIAEWLSPFTWLVRTGCGYDLSAHVRNGSHSFPITCPECGRVARRQRDLLRTQARWRLFGMGAILSLAAAGLFVEGFFAQTHWDEDLPTGALVQIERWWGERAPIGVRKQLRKRLAAMSGEEQTALAPIFIGDLHSQPDAWQPVGSGWVLAQRDSPEIRAVLRAALRSDDWKQRQSAAEFLRDRDEAPTFDLLRATLEGLRCDSTWFYGFNASNTWRIRQYLMRHSTAVQAFLRSTLSAIDVQQQQMIAHLLIEMSEPPTMAMLGALIRGFTRPEAKFEREAHEYLFDQGLPRVVDYLGRHGEVSIPFLRACLRENRGTARAYAACLLREIDPDVDHDLFVALTDALAFDPWRDDRDIGEQALRNFMLYDTLDYLVEQGPDAAEALRYGMRSTDAQQRVVCAAIAGFAELEDLAGDAAPVLLQRLFDNQVSADAVFAAKALTGFGAAIQARIAEAKDEFDAQGNEVLIYLLDRLEGKPALLVRPGTRWNGLLDGKTNDPARLDWRKLTIPRIPPALPAPP